MPSRYLLIASVFLLSAFTTVGCGINSTKSTTNQSGSSNNQSANGKNVTKNATSNTVNQRFADGSTASEQLVSMEEQLELLQNAVKPTNPLDAVNTWARAIKSRNGALQYAVLTPSLQQNEESV